MFNFTKKNISTAASANIAGIQWFKHEVSQENGTIEAECVLDFFGDPSYESVELAANNHFSSIHNVNATDCELRKIRTGKYYYHAFYKDIQPA